MDATLRLASNMSCFWHLVNIAFKRSQFNAASCTVSANLPPSPRVDCGFLEEPHRMDIWKVLEILSHIWQSVPGFFSIPQWGTAGNKDT